MTTIRAPQPTGPELRFSSAAHPPGFMQEPVVTSLADGDFVVSWAHFDAATSGHDVYARRYGADGAAQGADLRVNTTSVGNQWEPVTTALPSGGFVIAWSGHGPANGDDDIHAQRYDADGAAMGGEFRVNTTVAGGQFQPGVAGLADGGFVVAWHSFDPATTGYNIHAQRYGADGAAMGGEFRVNAVAAGTGANVEPAIVGLADGGFVVSWAARYPVTGSEEIYARRYGADGAAAGDAFRVNTATANGQSDPAVAALPDGGFAVAWASYDPSVQNFDIHAQRFASTGAAVGSEFRVNASAAENQHQPAISAVADGGFVVAWTGHDPTSGHHIHAQRYGADGAAMDGEFRAAATPSRQEGDARVVSLPDGGFAVSWNLGSLSPESRLQRFTLPPNVGEVSIKQSGAPTAEGASGAGAFGFTVNLDRPAATAQTVRWQVEGSGAAPADASDFAGGALASGTVVFNPGETSKPIAVRVTDDAAAEADEGFAVRLSDPSAGLAIGAAGVATAAVLNDDLPVVTGSDGADVFVHPSGQGRAYEGLGGRDVLDFGGQGFRGVLGAPLPDGIFLSAATSDRAVLRGVEEARFADGRLVFDENDPAAQVTRLYKAALGREADQGGLNGWTEALQGGRPLSGLADGFLRSEEFALRYGDLADNGAFVDRLYQNVLGREADAVGKQSWVAALNNGMTRADALVGFSESTENKLNTAGMVQNGIWDRSETAAAVARLYDTVLGRAPDAGGLVSWTDAIDGGMSLAQAAGGFAASAEFQLKYGNLDNTHFVQALYRNTLHREAEQAGLDHWVNHINSGAPRSAVVLGFSESAEHVLLTARNIQSDNPGEFGILFA